MKTVGITAEYNPFHNGHAYHIRKARQLTGAECVVAVMSGDFTQRGEPAVCDKWERAKASVTASPDGGADLVVELPFVFACSRAELFAKGAVDLLVRMGADCVSFGCEAEDPELLRRLADILVKEEEGIEAARSANMKKGLSAAKAYELAVTDAAGEEAAGLLLAPNNILALEYLKRIIFWRGRGCIVDDLPVRRYGSGYDEVSGEDPDFAGAGAIRKMIAEGADVRRFLPGVMPFEDVKLMSERTLQLLKGIVLRSDPAETGRIYGVGEGMENAIVREVRKAQSLEQLISALTSKRYTRATVRRTLTHMLVGTSWEEADRLTGEGPSAARLLAADEAGRYLMRELDEERFLIVTNINKEADKLDKQAAGLLHLDEKAADIYNVLRGREIYSASDRVMRPYIE